RLNNIRYCIEHCLINNIPEDCAKTGVCRCGDTIFMKGTLKVHGDDNRKVFVADSFEGLPPPDSDKYPSDNDHPLHLIEPLAISKEEVGRNFVAYALLDSNVIFVKEFFETSLANAPIDKIAVLRLDGDSISD